MFGSIDLAGRGIEIGALHNPRLRKHQGNLRYVDHASLADLKAKYRADTALAPYMDEMVEVDYVWPPGETLREVLGDWAPVDYVVAGHVIEHVPNPLRWLQEIAAVVREGGFVSLVIPDKRFCFDARRQVSGLADYVDLALRDVKLPTYRQIFDHEYKHLNDAPTEALWDGLDVEGQARTDKDSAAQYAYGRCLEVDRTGEYFDVHATTYTPRSFLDIVEGLVELDFFDYGIDAFYPTERNSLEFFVTLVRLDPSKPTERRAYQARSLAQAREALLGADVPGAPPPTPPPPPTPAFEVSPLERRMVEAKRRAIWRVRSLLAQRRGLRS